MYLLNQNLLFITLSVNDKQVRALVDTGASISIINARVFEGPTRTGRPIQVQGYDGSSRLLTEWASVKLEYQAQTIEVDVLVMEGVDYDFLLSRPHMKALQLNLYWTDEVNVEGNLRTANALRGERPTLASAEDVVTLFPELRCIATCPPAISGFTVPFKLRDTTVVRRKPYPLSRERKIWLQTELQTMLDAKIIRPSTSTFASPITIAPKEDGTYRLCTDYRLINRQTDLFPYPMPHIDDIINDTGGSTVFSCIDLTKGYWQVPLDEDYKKYTAFVTPFDLYEYNRLPFGWKNSGAWFQKIMDEVLRPFRGKFCAVYIDDIIIYSKSEKEHGVHLEQVLTALSQHGMKINFKKSVFFKDKVVFLGRVLDGRSKTTKQESVDRIANLDKPHDVHSLRVFLGLAGHFRAFIQNYAALTKCLTQLTRKDTPFTWTQACESAYQELLRRISSDPVLSLPDFSLDFELKTDASHYGTGAILYQRRKENPKGRQLSVVGYHSHTFSAQEINYTTTEKEALAVLLAARYFRPFIEGKRFVLFTDNQALSYLLTLSEPKGRIARWICELQQFDFQALHRRASDMTDADALSRLAISPDLSAGAVNAVKRWEGYERLEPQDGKLHVPDTLIPSILQLYHDSPESGGHDGFWRTYNKIVHRFTWKNMKSDVAQYVATCPVCQRHKAKFRRTSDVMVLPQHSTIPFHTIHLDFAELRKKGEGVRRTQAFLVAIDQCTRMVAVRPGREDANGVISMLERDMFKDTKVVVSDNGPAFRSRRLTEWAEAKGIRLQPTTPYHPAANGMAERVIRDLKQYISVYPDFPGGWKCALEAAVRHHNRSHTTALGCSPQYAAYSNPALFPADVQLGVTDHVTLQEHKRSPEQLKKYRSRMKKNFDSRRSQKIPVIQIGDQILVRHGLPGSKAEFCGPYLVVKTVQQGGVLKAVGYTGERGRTEMATIGNVIVYHPRRDGFRSPGVCSGHRGRGSVTEGGGK